MKIGNLNGIPWYLRLSIFVGIALAIYGGFWYFVTSGTRKETRDLQAQIAVMQKANAEAQIASQRLNEFRTAYKNKQEELEELRALLPEQRELTKVLDGCGLGNHFWVFAGGLTDVQVALTVTDTANGAVRVYHNPQGTPFQPLQDTSGFPCS